MPTAKLPWQSKLNWLGLAMVLLPVAEYFSQQPLVTDNRIALAACGAAVLVLRAVTRQPIRWSSEPNG